MSARAATPLTYFTEILAMSWRHGGEFAVAVGCIGIAGVSALLMRSLLRLQALSGPQVLLLLLPLTGAALLVLAAVAAWRLHRRQRIALATARSLVALNAGDRADLERDLRALYDRRERRIEERHTARIG